MEKSRKLKSPFSNYTPHHFVGSYKGNVCVSIHVLRGVCVNYGMAFLVQPCNLSFEQNLHYTGVCSSFQIYSKSAGLLGLARVYRQMKPYTSSLPQYM